MFARIGWYVFFLVAVGVYFAVSGMSQTKQKQMLTSRRGSVFLSNQLTIVAGLIPLVAIPWILTGFFNKNFFLLILLAFEVSTILTLISFYVFRLTPADIGKRFALWGGELGMKHPFSVFLPVMLLALAGLVAYLVFATYFYFAHSLRSQTAVKRILLLNFALYLVGAFIVLIINTAQLASAHINDRTRRGLFFAQVTVALQTGLILTLYLALLGIGGERFMPASLNISAAYSQYIPIGILTALYLLILVVPYFVGLENRRREEISLYGIHLDLVQKIIDVVGIPDIHDVDQLKKLRDDFEQESDDWIEDEPIIKELAIKVEHPSSAEPLAEALEPLVAPYHTLKTEDLRFVRLTWIDAMKSKFTEMITQYEQYSGEADRLPKHIAFAGPLVQYFRDQREGLEKKLKEAEERKVIAPVIARLVPTLGAVPVVWQYGQKIVKILPLNW